MKKCPTIEDRINEEAHELTDKKLALETATLVAAIVKLLERGLVLRIESDGSMTMRDEKVHRRKTLKSERNRRDYQKRKASTKRLN